MKKLIFLLGIVSSSLYAGGESEEVDIPENFIVIEPNNLMTNNNYFVALELELPYTKPYGITKLFDPFYHNDAAIIFIDNLIVDGKLMKTNRGYVSFETDGVYTQNIGPYKINLQHRVILYFNTVKKNYVSLVYWNDYWAEYPLNLREYKISVDAKEAYMTYRIVFPGGIRTEPITVYWKFDWPSEFGWERD